MMAQRFAACADLAIRDIVRSLTACGEPLDPEAPNSYHPVGDSSIQPGALHMMSSELRHALRLLWKSKGITATTLLTLGLGIGAVCTGFGVALGALAGYMAATRPPRPSTTTTTMQSTEKVG